ncbi:MAG: hypothetical protein KTR30_11810 [Saprospiraceae bacterium]|nr:hypothetical protein [Saprospiraceae bacterium]
MIQALKRAVLGKGYADPALRQEVYEKVSDLVLTGDDTPLTAPALNSYINKLSNHAYKILDQDIEALKAEGYSEDEIFEFTVVGATAAGVTRFEKGFSILQKLK